MEYDLRVLSSLAKTPYIYIFMCGIICFLGREKLANSHEKTADQTVESAGEEVIMPTVRTGQ
jgi:hypothetical protein